MKRIKKCTVTGCTGKADYKIRIDTLVGKMHIHRCSKHANDKDAQKRLCYRMALDATPFF